MKKIRLAILSFMIILCSAGCRTHDPVYDLMVCGSYSVPGMLCYDLGDRTTTCEVLETDEQGRVLFSYSTQSVITGEKEAAVIICQVSDSQEVRFYEDINYYIGVPDEDKTIALKEQNDWGKPLDYSKMVSRSYVISLDMCLHVDSTLNHAKLKSACGEEFNFDKTQIKELVFLSRDSCGRSMYWLTIKGVGEMKKYIIIADKNYEIASMNANGSLEDLANIPQFKKQNGWGEK